MTRQDDLILEGVKDRELASLQALAGGGTQPAAGDLAPLRAKGWVEIIGEDALITLTGRTLLDGQSARLR